MARMPALVETLARLDGRPFATIDNYARCLRLGGFIGHSERGRAASHVTTEDAANLLIGILATDSPTASPRVVDIYRGLKRLPDPHPRDIPRTLGLLIKLPTFGDFLSGLIDYATPLRHELDDYGLELQIGRSAPAARLLYRHPLGRRRAIADWVCYPSSGSDKLPEAEAGTDRRIIASCTHRTLYAVSALLENHEVDA